MKRALMVAAVVLLVACQAAADGPHGEGEREGHPAKRSAEWLHVSPYKPRRWIFEGPGGECRVLVAVPFGVPGDYRGQPCPDGYRLPWRRGKDGR